MRVPLQEGAQVFIDANIFLNVIFENPEFSDPSARFLEDIHHGIFHGTTSVLVLNEVLHRLLIAVVVNEVRISSRDAVAYLKSSPEYVRGAGKVWALIEDIRSMENRKVFGISEKTFIRSRSVMKDSGLMSNDALHVACMDEHAVDTIATYDRDFERVSRINVLKPGN